MQASSLPHAATLRPPRPLVTVLDWLGIGPYAFDDVLASINPRWTVFRIQAPVVKRISETPSACTLVLHPGARFPGLRAGQHLLVTVEIDGVRHRRAYSPRVFDAQDGTIAITIQRQPYGVVSNWLNDQIRPGDVLELGLPGGDFVLDQPLPHEVLMVAGGSGITPCRAMIDELYQRSSTSRVTLIYFARSHQERIFAADFERLAARWSHFRYLPIDTHANLASGPGAAGGPVLDRALLDRTLTYWPTLPAYCCGPAPLMDAARRVWDEAEALTHLRFEAFGPAPARTASGGVTQHQASWVRDGAVRVFAAASDQPLLLAGEAQGLSLPHGCRQGVCHECACHLQEGSVIDLQSGERIVGEGQVIRLCMTAASSDVKLAAAT